MLLIFLSELSNSCFLCHFLSIILNLHLILIARVKMPMDERMMVQIFRNSTPNERFETILILHEQMSSYWLEKGRLLFRKQIIWPPAKVDSFEKLFSFLTTIWSCRPGSRNQRESFDTYHYHFQLLCSYCILTNYHVSLAVSLKHMLACHFPFYYSFY